MQLVAYGAQDVYLTGNPQITFFKVVYRRHTNFSMESIEQTFDGSAEYGRRVSCTISRNGDLISNMYLRCQPNAAAGVDGKGPAGYNLISSATLEIGGQQIDKHYGHWMNVWSMLSTPSAQVKNLNTMTNSEATGNTAGSSKMLYVPFQFWFCRNPGLALPLIALQYHEVKLVVELAEGVNVAAADATGARGWTSAPTLFVDYIYLDTDERRRFAQVSHEYLIEQLQFTGEEAGGSNKKHQLNFNHPVKELIWASFNGSVEPTTNKCSNVRLMLNGHDRFSERDGTYFTNVQPWQHHTGCPMTLVRGAKGGLGRDVHHEGAAVHVYSFALKPEEHQPSGTCNMSRIDTAVLSMNSQAAVVTGTALVQHEGTLRIYAVNYNVLRIMSGMGGLAYSN